MFLWIRRAPSRFSSSDVFRSQHARHHTDKPVGFPDHLNAAGAVSAKGRRPACCVPYAASRIFVAAACGGFAIAADMDVIGNDRLG
jgi:hypothetical protein